LVLNSQYLLAGVLNLLTEASLILYFSSIHYKLKNNNKLRLVFVPYYLLYLRASSHSFHVCIHPTIHNSTLKI
jgi:hypothetical protein